MELCNPKYPVADLGEGPEGPGPPPYFGREKKK